MATGWRLAHSLEVLRAEVDTRWPDRSKLSDGTIGDAAHRSQGSASDHNPFIIDANGIGVVRAFDITAATIDASGLAEHLRQLGAHGDARLLDHGYVIYDRRIASEQDAWAWRPYSGSDPHTSHIHVSVARDPNYDSGAAWGVSTVLPPAPPGGNKVFPQPSIAGCAGPRPGTWLALHPDGGVEFQGFDFTKESFPTYTVMANATDTNLSQAYTFGPDRNGGVQSYPGLPETDRQGARTFVAIWLD